MSVRLLLDENLSERLLTSLHGSFPSSVHVRALGLGGAADSELWEMAKRDNFVLVTKDEDFVAMSVLRGTPPKVLWLNIGNANNAETIWLVLQHVLDIEQFVDHPDAGFLALRFGPQSH